MDQKCTMSYISKTDLAKAIYIGYCFAALCKVLQQEHLCKLNCGGPDRSKTSLKQRHSLYHIRGSMNQGHLDRWTMLLMHETQILLSKDWLFVIVQHSHSQHEGNSCVNWLANQARYLLFGLLILTDKPNSLKTFTPC